MSLRVIIQETQQDQQPIYRPTVMEHLAALVRAPRQNPDEVIAAVRLRSEWLHASSQRTGDGTTELMEAIRAVLQEEGWNPWVIGIMLQFQAKTLSDGCFVSFFFLAKQFFEHLTNPDALILFREGIVYLVILVIFLVSML